jgi:hypothetical protein
VTYVLAVLSVGAACILWYGVQRWAESGHGVLGQEEDADCPSCGLRDAGCPQAARVPEPQRDRENAA